MIDIKAVDVTDPDEIASELYTFGQKYAKRTGDYSNASMMTVAADWLMHLSAKVSEAQTRDEAEQTSLVPLSE